MYKNSGNWIRNYVIVIVIFLTSSLRCDSFYSLTRFLVSYVINKYY